ncbi:MAG TPA: AAA family ATPase, partial [Thermoanaerobaculia bacterium]|nr:AAA family ATPase [Thermoanaerobaculia bacterium]
MTDLAERRLHGIAVYNPDLLSKQELVAQFVARRELFAELVADLRRPKFTQHQLIVGHRGMGKTTLLRRLRYAVEDDPKLSNRWIALAFPEEQYNVSRLSDLYLNCVDALSDALERTGQQNEADALDEARENLSDDDETRRAAAALDLLLGTARRLKRRLLLLVDNLDLILDRLKTEQWTLRELLSREDRLLLIGATPFVIGATYEYDAPFYDFFRVHELRGLSFEETSEVLVTLAREMSAPDVERLVHDEPARIRTLHVLAGGNPRTVVLLFSVLAQGTDGDVRSDLEKLLDQSTPLYKARFEAMAPQAQQVVDALAIHWDPISAAELAERLRLDVNVVSSQLNRLAQQSVVEKVPYDPSSKSGFQIAERFFNIWYLMRASRRVRRRLTWLVQFLKLFYGLDQLQRKARELLRSTTDAMSLRKAELCLAIAESLGEDRPTQLALESRAIRAMLATDDLRREMQSLFDLEGEDRALKPVIDRQTWAQEYGRAIDAAPDGETADLLRVMGGLFTDIGPDQKLMIARRFASLPGDLRQELQQVLTTSQQYSRRLLGTALADQLANAILGGYVTQLDDEEGLSAAGAALGMPALELLLGPPAPLEKIQEIARVTDEPLAWARAATQLARDGLK